MEGGMIMMPILQERSLRFRKPEVLCCFRDTDFERRPE